MNAATYAVDGRLTAAKLQLTLGIAQLAVPALRNAGVPDSICDALEQGELPFVDVDGSEYALDINGLPPSIRNFLRSAGLQSLVGHATRCFPVG